VVALASAALVLYPAAMVLPVLEIERLGHRSAATIWSGALELLREGSVAVGVIVLVCSIIIPAFKLIGILLLCTRLEWFERRHRAATYHAVEWLGRWGMVDVLLVAVLVAAVKLGSWVQVSPGPGSAAFAAVVVLSMLASAVFDPAQIWEEHA
jgi:paraquat-inducible protein A